jgi:hypothetical protein
MIARLTSHRAATSDAGERVALLATQAGFCAGYQLADSLTGENLTLTVWESKAAVAAAGQRCGDNGSTGGGSEASVRVLDILAVF